MEANRAVFDEFDLDGSGEISISELKLVFARMGHHKTEKELAELIKQVDADSNEMIDFAEFITLLDILKKEFERKTFVAKARAVFDMFDVDGSGEIEASELSQIITQITGVTPTEAVLQQLLEQIDTDGNNLVDFDEFLACLDSGALKKKQNKTEKEDEKDLDFLELINNSD